MGLTDAQYDVLATLDDVSEHVGFEHDPHDYEGPSTCGFAHIKIRDGRSSFVRRVKALAQADHPQVTENRRNEYQATVGCLNLSLRPQGRSSGYRLSITNVSDHAIGPSHQRLDLREALHEMVLNRLQYNGYCEEARVYSRMD